MPTIRPTKRLLMPLNKRSKAIVEQIIDDQSELWGISNSDAIIKDVLDSHLPPEGFARDHAESVFAGDVTLLGDVASVLRANVTGSIGNVQHDDYRKLVEFGLEMVRHKHLETGLNTHHPEAHHAIFCFTDVVDNLEQILGQEEEATSRFDIQRKVSFGRNLLDEINPERFSRAPATAFIQYATEDFERIGKWNSTCAYLADIFSILDETARRCAEDGTFRVPCDTAEQRRKWVKVLSENTANWGAP